MGIETIQFSGGGGGQNGGALCSKPHNQSGYDGDNFIRQSKMNMTQSKLLILGSDYVTRQEILKPKHQISFDEVLIVKNCQS